MPPPAGGEGMTGNRVPRFRHTVHIGRWRTRPPTNTLPGVHIMRHSEPASWPSPLRGSTFRSSLDPDPSLAFVCTEPGTRTDQSQTPWPRWVDRPRSFRDYQLLGYKTPHEVHNEYLNRPLAAYVRSIVSCPENPGLPSPPWCRDGCAVEAVPPGRRCRCPVPPRARPEVEPQAGRDLQRLRSCVADDPAPRRAGRHSPTFPLPTLAS